jgi:hypothetical protein
MIMTVWSLLLLGDMEKDDELSSESPSCTPICVCVYMYVCIHEMHMHVLNLSLT